MDEFHSDLKSDTKDEVRESIKRRMRISALMSIILPLTPILIFLVQYSIPQNVTTFLLIGLLVVGLLGFLSLGYYVMGSRMLFRGIDVLNQIAPPEPFIEGKLVILNKDPVYVIIQWGSNALIFVTFLQSERSFDKSVGFPRVIWKWEYTHPIGDIKVARREGNYTIPVDRDTYYTGHGILYSLLLEETKIVTIHKSYTAEQLNQIVESLAREVVTYRSSEVVDDNF